MSTIKLKNLSYSPRTARQKVHVLDEGVDEHEAMQEQARKSLKGLEESDLKQETSKIEAFNPSKFGF